MENILIIEDDDFKAKSLQLFLSAEFKAAKFTVVTSLVEAIRCVTEEIYDLVLVDMAIPSHPSVSGGGSPLSLLSGGLDVLMELADMGRDDPCIVITQFSDIEMSEKYYLVENSVEMLNCQIPGCNVKACILYDEGSDHWKHEMLRAVKS